MLLILLKLVIVFIYMYICMYITMYIYFFFSFLFRAAPTAYGNSQARGWIGAATAGLQLQQLRIRAMSATYTSAHGNARSLIHRARSGIEPASSPLLVMSITAEHNGNAYTYVYSIVSNSQIKSPC